MEAHTPNARYRSPESQTITLHTFLSCVLGVAPPPRRPQVGKERSRDDTKYIVRVYFARSHKHKKRFCNFTSTSRGTLILCFTSDKSDFHGSMMHPKKGIHRHRHGLPFPFSPSTVSVALLNSYARHATSITRRGDGANRSRRGRESAPHMKIGATTEACVY